jgi:hypothetical protein
MLLLTHLSELRRTAPRQCQSGHNRHTWRLRITAADFARHAWTWLWLCVRITWHSNIGRMRGTRRSSFHVRTALQGQGVFVSLQMCDFPSHPARVYFAKRETMCVRAHARILAWLRHDLSTYSFQLAIRFTIRRRTISTLKLPLCNPLCTHVNHSRSTPAHRR